MRVCVTLASTLSKKRAKPNVGLDGHDDRRAMGRVDSISDRNCGCRQCGNAALRHGRRSNPPRSTNEVQQRTLSAILHGVWLLVFVAFLGFLLRLIPTCALAAILVYTGYKLVDPKSIKELLKYGRGEVAIYTATVMAIVIADLLT